MKIKFKARLAAILIGSSLLSTAVSVQPANAVNMWVYNSSNSHYQILIDDSCHSPMYVPRGGSRVLNCSGRRIWIGNDVYIRGIGVGNWAYTCGSIPGGYWKSFSYSPRVTFTAKNC